jgi:D,D-heptose 1,7-bisphosphate phosphatase
MSGVKRTGAVFMDRDGTVNKEVGYLDNLTKLKLFPQTFAAIGKINKSGMKAVVVTNQSGVARGYFSEEFVSEVHSRIQEMLAEKGAYIDAFYYCPHHPTEGCESYTKPCRCRKPEAELFLQAVQDFNIDLQLSYMIGDTLKDIEAALKIGAKGVLVRTGYGREVERDLPASEVRPEYIADDILDAVHWIMQDRNQ